MACTESSAHRRRGALLDTCWESAYEVTVRVFDEAGNGFRKRGSRSAFNVPDEPDFPIDSHRHGNGPSALPKGATIPSERGAETVRWRCHNVAKTWVDFRGFRKTRADAAGATSW